jgi:hypothetical protein
MCLIVPTITLLMAGIASAEENHYSIGLGFEFSSGKYGTDTRTDSVLVPFTVVVSPTDRLGFSLEIPYIYQSNGNVVASIASGAGMQGSKSAMKSVGSMMGGSGGAMSSGTGGMGHQGGLGDITLKGSYIVIPEQEAVPQIRPYAFVKFPTADKNDSLGTGEFDEGFAVEVSKWIGKWNPFAEAGYTVQGKSPLLPLKNYVTYDGGIGYQLADSVRAIVFLKGSTPPSDGFSSLLETRIKLSYQTTKQSGIEGYLSKGITTNSPDYGTGLSVYFDF